MINDTVLQSLGKTDTIEVNTLKLRYFLTKDTTSPLMIILPGVTEPIEKYSHVIEKLVTKGFSVACLDWPDQGLSSRYLSDTTARYSLGFDKEVAAFTAFYKHLQTLISPTSTHILAHSMGAHLTLRALLSNTEIEPDTVLLSAPLIDLYFASKAESIISRLIIKTACLCGLSREFPPGLGEWSPQQFDKTKEKFCSHPIRKDLLKTIYTRHPDLTSGGITFGWLGEALRSIDWLRHHKARLNRLNMPMHVFIAEQDIVVDNQSIKHFLKDAVTVKIHSLPDSYHEILMEPDELQKPVWDVIDSLAAN